LIKILLIIFVFLTSSCSGISLNNLKLLKDSIYENTLDEGKLYSEKYSHLIIKGKNIASVFILESRINNVDKWIGANGEIIYTLDGLVVGAELIGDGYFLSSYPLNTITANNINDLFEQRYFANYKEKNIYNLKVEYKDIVVTDSTECSRYITAKRFFADSRLNDSISLCFDAKGSPYNSKQSIEPGTEYKIKYNYLY